MTKLFIPDKVQIPKIAAIHDLCGYGSCSLTTAISVLSAAGLEVCPVPTSYLSTHTAFGSYTFFDTTENLPTYLDHWSEVKVPLAGAYTGFLGSFEQISIIIDFFDKYPDMLRIVDPVMADLGVIYKTYTEEMCMEMKELASAADLIMPNLTEAAVLLGTEYQGQFLDEAETRAICDQLLQLGCKHVILKGIRRDDAAMIWNCIASDDGSYAEYGHKRVNASMHGTGDFFASIVTAGIFSGKELEDTVRFAGELVHDAMEFSFSQEGWQDRGVNFEPFLRSVADYCGSDEDAAARLQ
ncbi:MAG TPA: pyridoxamine kinase [Clostridiaceae bacterium]|nr:pyridoxamine kinase [Clostridiaceae bacterium]